MVDCDRNGSRFGYYRVYVPVFSKRCDVICVLMITIAFCITCMEKGCFPRLEVCNARAPIEG